MRVRHGGRKGRRTGENATRAARRGRRARDPQGGGCTRGGALRGCEGQKKASRGWQSGAAAGYVYILCADAGAGGLPAARPAGARGTFQRPLARFAAAVAGLVAAVILFRCRHGRVARGEAQALLVPAPAHAHAVAQTGSRGIRAGTHGLYMCRGPGVFTNPSTPVQDSRFRTRLPAACAAAHEYTPRGNVCIYYARHPRPRPAPPPQDWFAWVVNNTCQVDRPRIWMPAVRVGGNKERGRRHTRRPRAWVGLKEPCPSHSLSVAAAGPRGARQSPPRAQSKKLFTIKHVRHADLCRGSSHLARTGHGRHRPQGRANRPGTCSRMPRGGHGGQAVRRMT